MFIGLETRAPFLDPEMIALAARLPSNMRFRDNKGKWALRQVLFKYVPRELIERPKTGFSIPVGPWLRGPLREWAEDLLSVESLKSGGLLDPVPVRAAWKQHLEGRYDWSNRLWSVLMLQAWQAHNRSSPEVLRAA
jgi:asparagine synthase (glutamine-hydrolysing)